MSTIESIDAQIEDLIDTLMREYNQTGFLSGATPERKHEIIDEIATLRASMSPQCNCQK